MPAPTSRRGPEMPAGRIAIVGGGPAGCFAAQHMRKKWPQATIDIIDREPTPYGLLRYGVAPDHQGTKAVCRQFERLFLRDGVRFIGNIDVGQDVSLGQLRAIYDVVLLSTGLRGDRKLAISGYDLPQVYGSGKVTRMLNDYPHDSGEIDFGERVVIIGNGNVAVDIIRMLCKTEDEFAGSDIHNETVTRLRRRPVRSIDVIGRSSIQSAKFDSVMVRELAKLSDARFSVADGTALAQADTEDPRVAAVQSLLDCADEPPRTTTVTFHFESKPLEIRRCEHTTYVALARADSDTEAAVLACDSVVTAIGFEECVGTDVGIDSLRGNCCPKNSGRIDDGLYHAGWLHRGGRGALPEIRLAARSVVDCIVDDVACARLPIRAGVAPGLPQGVLAKMTDFAGWIRIDAAETSAAPENRTRQKIRVQSEMLRLARESNEMDVVAAAQP